MAPNTHAPDAPSVQPVNKPGNPSLSDLTSSQLRRLRRLLRDLEPDCDCPDTMKPVCERFGGCEKKRAGEMCDCPRWPGPPCHHLVHKAIVAVKGRVKFRQWAALLRAAWPRPTTDDNDYLDRQEAAEGAELLTRENRISMYVLRADLGLSLWHPRDRYKKTGVASRQTIIGYKDGPDGYPRPIKEEKLVAVKDGKAVRGEDAA